MILLEECRSRSGHGGGSPSGDTGSYWNNVLKFPLLSSWSVRGQGLCRCNRYLNALRNGLNQKEQWHKYYITRKHSNFNQNVGEDLLYLQVVLLHIKCIVDLPRKIVHWFLAHSSYDLVSSREWSIWTQASQFFREIHLSCNTAKHLHVMLNYISQTKTWRNFLLEKAFKQNHGQIFKQSAIALNKWNISFSIFSAVIFRKPAP